MTLLWCLLGIIGIIALAVIWPIGLGVALKWRHDEGLTWRLSVRLWSGLLPLSFSRVPSFIKEKTNSGLASVPKITPETLHKIPSIATLRQILVDASPVVRFATRCLRLKRLDIYLAYGSGDAASTGQATGYFWAVMPLIHNYCHQYPALRRIDFRYGLEPVFSGPEIGVDFRINSTIFPLLVLILGVRSYLLYRKIMKMEAVQ